MSNGPSVADRRGWLPGLEALRGLAAGTVVLHHSWSLSTMPRYRGDWIIEGFGSFGVNLFFLLSGYLLADYWWREKDRRSLAEYGLRRFFRIGPAYYANVIILFVFFAAPGMLLTEQGMRQLAANLTFTHYLTPDTSSSLNVNGALWTMTIEFMLYALLPIMALAFGRWRVSTFVVLMGIGIGWRIFIARAGDSLRELYFGQAHGGAAEGIWNLFLARQFPGLVPIFALGIALKWMSLKGYLDWARALVPQRMSVLLLAVLLVPAVLWLRLVEPGSNYQNWLLFTVFDYVMALLFIPALIAATKEGWTPRTPLAKVSAWLGDRSFSLYLWHFPIVLTVYGRGPLLNGPNVTHVWFRLFAIGVLSLLFASASYSLIERPGQEYGRKIAARVATRRLARRTANAATAAPAADVVASRS